MNKRGQLTAILIVGILLVVAGVTIYFVKTRLLTSEWEREKAKAEIIPEKAQRVKSYVESCIQQNLQDALTLSELQSGFIYIPQDSIPLSLANPMSNSLSLFDNSGAKVPYWFYETANGIKENQIPTLQSIESQMELYTEENIMRCINDFAPLRNAGYEVEYSKAVPQIEIGEDKILSTTTLPIILKIEDFTFQFERFYVDLETNFKGLYESAIEIMNKENEATFIEQFTLDQMIVYNEIPFSGVDFECTPRSWTRSEVYLKIKDMLATNIPSIKIDGSEFTLNNEFDKYHVVEDVDLSDELSINFLYSQDWPLLMDILGEDSQIIRGKPITLDNEASQFTLPLFCLNDNHFVYDLKFPILISLSKGNDIFQFAVQSIIDNNQPRENQYEIVNLDTESNICKYPNSRLTIFALAKRPDGSLQSLKDAKVSIRCVDATCELGITQLENSDYSLTTLAPACLNAKITAEKEGFYKGSEFISTNQESVASVILEPLYELNLEVNVQAESTRPIQPTEQVIFTFKNTDNDYTTTIVYPGSDKIKLIAGTYSVESSLIVSSSSGLSIPDKEIEVCSDSPRKGLAGVIGLKQKVCEKQTIKGTKVDQVLAGGGQFTWTVTAQDLTNSNKITIYTVRGKIPSSFDDLIKTEDAKKEFSKKINKPKLS